MRNNIGLHFLLLEFHLTDHRILHRFKEALIIFFLVGRGSGDWRILILDLRRILIFVIIEVIISWEYSAVIVAWKFFGDKFFSFL